MSTLYKKDPNDLGRVINEVNPEMLGCLSQESLHVNTMGHLVQLSMVSYISVMMQRKIRKLVNSNFPERFYSLVPRKSKQSFLTK